MPPEAMFAVAEMTVQSDGNFWSSTGSPHEIGEEFILYKLQHPLAVVRAVVVQVYRATFQGGCAFVCFRPCAQDTCLLYQVYECCTALDQLAVTAGARYTPRDRF